MEGSKGGSSTSSYKHIVAGRGKKLVEEDRGPSENVRKKIRNRSRMALKLGKATTLKTTRKKTRNRI